MSQQSSDVNKTSSILYYSYAGLTNVGRIRDHNEDAFKTPEGSASTDLSDKGYLYVLADGMGGHQKGEVASAVTIETVNSEYYAIVGPISSASPDEAIVQALTKAIEKANDEVMEATEGGGTTVVAAVMHGNLLTVMNVGDSRAYLLRDDKLQLISRDHSLVSRLVEMGKITEEEASTHPRRNVLYQALGQGSDVEIHTYQATIQAHDTIILCSDGLWGEVQEPDIKQVLNESDSPKDAATRLIDMANDSGGPDNITAIIIQVSDTPDDDATRPSDFDPEATMPSIQIRDFDSDAAA